MSSTIVYGYRAPQTFLLRPGRLTLVFVWLGAQHGGNLLEVHQFTHVQASWFFARMAIESETLSLNLPAVQAAFQPIGSELKAEWTIRAAESRMKVVIVVSKLSRSDQRANRCNKR